MSLAVRHVKVFMTKLVTAPTAVRMMIIPLPSMMTSARDRIQIMIVSRDRILIANAMVKHAQIVSHNFIIKLYYRFIKDLKILKMLVDCRFSQKEFRDDNRGHSVIFYC